MISNWKIWSQTAPLILENMGVGGGVVGVIIENTGGGGGCVGLIIENTGQYKAFSITEVGSEDRKLFGAKLVPEDLEL